MAILYFILIIFGVLYGILNIFAGFTQIKQKEINLWSSLSMIIGGLLIALSVLFFSKIFYTLYIVLVGLVLIHIATINNGIKMYGKINLSHHVIRFIFSVILIVLFIIYNS